MNYIWIVRYAEDDDIEVFNNPTAAYDCCVEYIKTLITNKNVIKECLEELRTHFLNDSSDFWCDSICECWKQEIKS